MGILGFFYPDSYSCDFYGMSKKLPEIMKKKGLVSVIFDIDNTLVPHGAPADERAKELFKELSKAGIKTMVLSNNGPERVRSFAEAVGTGYICNARKPSRGGYLKACAAMGSEPSKTLFVGDQIFTDIMGAKRAGLSSLLVEPVDRSTDIFKIRLKRIPESFILASYRRRQKKGKSPQRGCANS